LHHEAVFETKILVLFFKMYSCAGQIQTKLKVENGRFTAI